VRALLASPLGFLVGLSLGTLGGGGSILAVPVLVYAAGQDPRDATATSLLLVGVASIVGLGPHLRAGRVQVGVGVAVGVAGIGGSIAGSAVNRHLDPDVLLLGFAVLIVVAAWRMLTACPTCTEVGEKRALRSGGVDGARAKVDVGTVVAVLALGTGIGFLTGLFGVGGGFVIVPALTLVLKLSMPQAIGTSLLVIAINSAVALSARMATTTIDWAVAIPFVISAVVGVLVGGRIADRIDAERSLRWFAALLVTLALYTGIDATIALAT
jgi:uncharacterized protein